MVVTKKCPVCGREFFLQLVGGGRVLYLNDRVKFLQFCPYDGVYLDFNIHEFSVGGDDFIIDVTKKCSVCKFEVDLYNIVVGEHRIVKKEDKYEVEKRCPVCGGRLYVCHHLIVR